MRAEHDQHHEHRGRRDGLDAEAEHERRPEERRRDDEIRAQLAKLAQQEEDAWLQNLSNAERLESEKALREKRAKLLLELHLSELRQSQ